MNQTIALIIELAGTIAFAISGIRLGSAKQFDWFGAYVVGLVTAIGGGTLRDLMLGLPPFWMQNITYVAITALSLGFVIVFGRFINRLINTFFIFDTIGLGLFVVVGIQKTLDMDYPFWVAIIMGTVTGAFGGIMRDILINEVPLIFRKDIYALACVIGGLCYGACIYLFHLNVAITQIIAATTVVLVRIVAVKYHLSLPVLEDRR